MHPTHPPIPLLLLYLFFMILTPFVSCFSTYYDNPKTNYIHHDSYNSKAYNPYFTTIDRRATPTAYKPTFPSPVDSINLDNFHKALLRGSISTFERSLNIVNVDDFGAKADGTDDSEAFGKAWQEACSSTDSTVIVVPKNKIYHLKPVTFSGPCNADLTLRVHGTIKASPKRKDYEEDRKHWIVFNNVQNFRVRGGGTINGNGRIWWQNSCKINKKLPCTVAPTAVTFNGCRNLIVANLRFKNSQQMHLTFRGCVNVRALNLRVTAPGKSPNTDGIHVSGTQNIRIKNCVIRTGDDCISIVSGSKNVYATDITCGPGHGISIGSLGAGNSEAEVSNVFVNRATLSGTTNGLRIKTWQGGSGYAKNILFQNVVVKNVTNPIIINQNYCDQDEPCPEQANAVQVSNVVYKNIKGTSASKVAVNFDCSKTFPCQGISLQDISLTSEEEQQTPQASCSNVKLTNSAQVFPRCS